MPPDTLMARITHLRRFSSLGELRVVPKRATGGERQHSLSDPISRRSTRLAFEDDPEDGFADIECVCPRTSSGW